MNTTTIPQRFENICRTYPDLVAVKSGDQAVTYAELNARSNQVARMILKACGDRDCTVALLLKPGVALATGVMACLKATKMFVPLDPNNPPERQEFILEDAGSALVLSEGFGFSSPRAAVMDIDAPAPNLPVANLHREPRRDDRAFLLYTSGSTGSPKGVINLHRGIVARIADYNRFDVGPGDRLTALGPGGMNLFRALLTGATLVSLNLREVGVDHLADWLRAERITIYHSVPTVFRQFVSTLEGPQTFPDLRIVNLTGETLLSKDVAAFRRHFPASCVLVNGLGTTETGTFCEMRIDRETLIEGGIVPVGYAVEGLHVLLLDEKDGLIDDLQTGEIAVRGADISPGYWNRPESTADRFTDDPKRPGHCIYRTGDLGRFRRDGALLHLGRKDLQVKILGYRVEVGEIESAFLGHPAVRQAAVVGRRGEDGEDTRLAAYVARTPSARISSQDLKAFLRRRLPEYMLPVSITFVPDLPQTPNGKIDYTALPSVESAVAPGSDPAGAPRNETEAKLANIWRDVLRVEQVDVNENFFNLGGNSILAMRVMSRVHKDFRVEYPISAIFKYPTVATLAEFIAAARSALRPRATRGEGPRTGPR
ncbi:MAG: non-ribosomal peptide synthetase [Gammaproteobacteria bacterium]|nr:non-ribosomal peptide synthetase [Gammaproteobacteria bacterium]